MMKQFILVITIILLSFLSSVFSAIPVEFRSSVDHARVTTGDVITFELLLDSDPQIKIEIPDVGNNIKGFRIEDLGNDEPKERDGRTIKRRWYKLRADFTGSYILPSVEIVWKNPKDGKEEKVKTSEIFVEVETVLDEKGKDGKGDIRDLKPLAPSVRRPTLWFWLVITILTVGIIFAVWWRRRKVPVYTPPPTPAHEIAQKFLRELESADYLAKGEFKVFHFKLSEIVRWYVEQLISFPATDLTLEEIRLRLKNVSNMQEEHKMAFMKILERTDLVKFTDTVLPNEESLQLFQSAHDLIIETKPKEEVMVEESVI